MLGTPTEQIWLVGSDIMSILMPDSKGWVEALAS